MCSPAGSCTLNSLMKVATLRLLTTVHSYSLMLRMLSGSFRLMSSFTFTWQPRRQPSCICLRLKWGVSVGRMLPPPFTTRHLHWPQEPLPPQAEGRWTPASPRVLIKVPPVGTVSSLSSLIVIFTLPCGMSLARKMSSAATKSRMTTNIIAMAVISVVVIVGISC